MSKILKVIAMLLIIAGVVFVAGCANKSPTPANTTQAAPAETNVSTVTLAGTNESTVTPGETPVTVINTTETNATVITENNTSVPAAPGTHLSTAARHEALIKSQQQSNGTSNVTSSGY